MATSTCRAFCRPRADAFMHALISTFDIQGRVLNRHGSYRAGGQDARWRQELNPQQVKVSARTATKQQVQVRPRTPPKVQRMQVSSTMPPEEQSQVETWPGAYFSDRKDTANGTKHQDVWRKPDALQGDGELGPHMGAEVDA
ncbi:hypothetical protein PPTG_06740 [Phytophthora nicotianae INRA-310]|uniref:Uncharacterized protein n=1 Tax=Phytophthora nicotianae (strain INRA-310) TaxID=761204 RepID=W2QQT4_PHYN3|nr:hypothetical protein PPTG_06740 [Phytophthora nicotianae INRA-310]ETN15473.1 hypothetical protein PPTG_06740 [Phytophthora nicotianae INRA-310]